LGIGFQTIEILGATLEEACFEKGDFQLISTLFFELKRGFVGR
jgi:hypothetical protein